MARKHRSVEPSEERKVRIAENKRKQQADAEENDAAIDAMVKRNIEKHGP